MAYKYIVWNGTDGITATPDTYTSKKKAQEVIDKKREMYRTVQGYCRDNRQQKIDPSDIN